MMLLKIDKITKSYDAKHKAIDKVYLEIDQGDIFGFIGHNGAGKTTTLKCITGILSIDEGDVYINGISLKKEPIKCKQLIAYIPDNPNIYPYLSGWNYINFICDMYGVNKENRKTRVEKYAKLFDIESKLDDKISNYSNGMKQKIIIVAALAHEPDILILDEPFIGLDPESIYNLKGILREYSNSGHAVLFSSHVLDIVESLCNKIAIIKKGKIVVSGSKDEVIKNDKLENVFLEINKNE